MTTRQLLTTILLGLLAELTLLAVIVFLAEPEHVGGSAPRFHDRIVPLLSIDRIASVADSVTERKRSSL